MLKQSIVKITEAFKEFRYFFRKQRATEKIAMGSFIFVITKA